MDRYLTDEEIIKYQDELYELESSASIAPPISEEEKIKIINSYISGEFLKKIQSKIKAMNSKAINSELGNKHS